MDPKDDPLSLIDRLLGPIDLELRQGCRNRSVMMIGFAAHARALLLRWIPLLPLEDRREFLPLLESLTRYLDLPGMARREILDRLSNKIQIIKKKLTETPPPATVVEAVVPPPPLKEAETPPPVAQKRQGSRITPPLPDHVPSSELSQLSGVGPKILRELFAMGIQTFEDLLRYFPFRYEDRKDFVTEFPLTAQPVCVYGEVESPRMVKLRGTMAMFQCRLKTLAGPVQCRWFGMPFLARTLKAGRKIVCFGRFDPTRRDMAHPDFEFIDSEEESLNFGRIVPIYSFPATIKNRAIGARVLRRLIHCVLPNGGEGEMFPAPFLWQNNLVSLKEAFQHIHFPESFEKLKGAKRRFSFDELFLFVHGMERLKEGRRGVTPFRLEAKVDHHLPDLLARLPFVLTEDQRRALDEMIAGCSRERPMHRLLQGDVGCGKTILVFLLAALLQRGAGKTLLMAPTTLLTQQHYQQLVPGGKFAPLGLRAAVLTSADRPKQRSAILEQWGQGEIDILIGTHALLSQSLAGSGIALVVVDEQHKFGVDQRMALFQNSPSAHTLFLSATPIPRTLSLTLYGYLEVSTLKQHPATRLDVSTHWYRSRAIAGLLERIRETTRQGHKTFFLCPLVEESEKIPLANVMERFEFLVQHLDGVRMDILHGKLPARQKEEVLAKFRDGELDLLVVTSVIEVGIDIPAATLLIVENAEHFGLAQLHQMRGRIGRRGEKAECILWSTANSADAIHRLETFCRFQDGFLLAEEDLRFRGPGEFFGSDQSGVPKKVLSQLVCEEDFILWVKRVHAETPVEIFAAPKFQEEFQRFFKGTTFSAFLSG